MRDVKVVVCGRSPVGRQSMALWLRDIDEDLRIVGEAPSLRAAMSIIRGSGAHLLVVLDAEPEEVDAAIRSLRRSVSRPPKVVYVPRTAFVHRRLEGLAVTLPRSRHTRRTMRSVLERVIGTVSA